jgi:DNA invertase Pin-like site-specific DNA recombinase
MNMMYGYARVSTDGQSVEAQVAALTAAGAVTVYRVVASGAKTDGVKLRQMLARLAAGDVLIVTRLDRKRMMLSMWSEGYYTCSPQVGVPGATAG